MLFWRGVLKLDKRVGIELSNRLRQISQKKIDETGRERYKITEFKIL